MKARKAIRLAAIFEQIFIACEAPFPAASSAFCSDPGSKCRLLDPVLLVSVSGWNNLAIPRAPGAAITEAEMR